MSTSALDYSIILNGRGLKEEAGQAQTDRGRNWAWTAESRQYATGNAVVSSDLKAVQSYQSRLDMVHDERQEENERATD